MLQPSALAHLALLASTVLWGSSFMAMKVAVTAYGPLPVIFLRMLVATGIFLAMRRSVLQRLHTPADILWIGLMALCEPCLYFLLEGNALLLTTSAQAGTVAAMLPLLMAVAARVVLGEALARRTLLGFGVSTLGVMLLTLTARTQETAPNPMLGNLLEFLAMVCATGYMITLKKLSPRYGPWFLTAMQAMVGAAFFLPVAAPRLAVVAHHGPAPLVAVLFLGSVITVGAYGLYNYGMSILPANRAAGYINLIPVVAVGLGWLVLGEEMTGPQAVAAAMVFAGVWLSQTN